MADVMGPEQVLRHLGRNNPVDVQRTFLQPQPQLQQRNNFKHPLQAILGGPSLLAMLA